MTKYYLEHDIPPYLSDSKEEQDEDGMVRNSRSHSDLSPRKIDTSQEADAAAGTLRETTKCVCRLLITMVAPYRLRASTRQFL